MQGQPHFDIDNDGLLKGAIGSLWFCGVVYLLLGLVVVVAGGAMAFLAPNDEGLMMGILYAVCVLPVCVVIAGANIGVARGLSQRKPWAWIGALVVGGLYLPSGCFPFGAVIFWAMLRPGFKDAYEASSPSSF